MDEQCNASCHSPDHTRLKICLGLKCAGWNLKEPSRFFLQTKSVSAERGSITVYRYFRKLYRLVPDVNSRHSKS